MTLSIGDRQLHLPNSIHAAQYQSSLFGGRHTPVVEDVTHRLDLGGTYDEVMAINLRCQAQAEAKRSGLAEWFPVMRGFRSAQNHGACQLQAAVACSCWT